MKDRKNGYWQKTRSFYCSICNNAYPFYKWRKCDLEKRSWCHPRLADLGKGAKKEMRASGQAWSIVPQTLWGGLERKNLCAHKNLMIFLKSKVINQAFVNNLLLKLPDQSPSEHTLNQTRWDLLSLMQQRTCPEGLWGLLGRGSWEGLLTGFGFMLDDFKEGLRKPELILSGCCPSGNVWIIYL